VHIMKPVEEDKDGKKKHQLIDVRASAASA
jgi:hypothetical protein